VVGGGLMAQARQVMVVGTAEYVLFAQQTCLSINSAMHLTNYFFFGMI
jgi:hypothetical protein